MPRDQRRNVSRDYIDWYAQRERYVRFWLYKAGKIHFGRYYRISDFQTIEDAVDFVEAYHARGARYALQSIRRDRYGRWYKWGDGEPLMPHLVDKIMDYVPTGYPEPPNE